MIILIAETHEKLFDVANDRDDVIARAASCLKEDEKTQDKGRSLTKVFLSNKNETNKNCSLKDETVYSNDSFTHSIRVDKLQEVIARKMTNGNKGFKSEYAVGQLI